MLTKDCICYLTKFLEYEDILSLTQVNRKTRSSLDNEFWKRYLKEKCNYEFHPELDKEEDIRHYYRFLPLDEWRASSLHSLIIKKQYLGLFDLLIKKTPHSHNACWESIKTFSLDHSNYFYHLITSINSNSLWNEYCISDMLVCQNYEIAKLFLPRSINLRYLIKILFDVTNEVSASCLILKESLMWLKSHFIANDIIKIITKIILKTKNHDPDKETKRYWKLWERSKLLILLSNKYCNEKVLQDAIPAKWDKFLLLMPGCRKPVDDLEKLNGNNLDEIWTNLGSIFLRHHEEWSYGHLTYLVQQGSIYNTW